MNMPSTSSDRELIASNQLRWFFSQSPLLGAPPAGSSGDAIPKSPITFHVMTPISSPMIKAVSTVHNYLEEVENNIAKVNPQDNWLPITQSRNGNAFYAAFHTLCSGIGFQALLLPLAFTSLGWILGIAWLTIGFMWQLYTMWLLIQLHELEDGTRYSRYLRLSIAAFGEKLGKLLSLFPVMYLSGGTCVALIMFGSGSMKIFYEIVCGPTCKRINPLTTLEWYIVFTCCAMILAQLIPNLNSIAKVSFVGSVSGVGYCTLIWIISVAKYQSEIISDKRTHVGLDDVGVCKILNAIGMVVFVFRGHNLTLEIQGTMPTSIKKPSRIPMWRGVKFAYAIIGLCLFPIAIGGYWANENLVITTKEGLLHVMPKYYTEQNTSNKFLLCSTILLVIIHSLSSFQLYAMPVFDNLEYRLYTSKKDKPCPRWLRSAIRAFFGCLTVFIACALPFLPKLAGLLGGIALPITLVYPCFMWLQIKKPPKLSFMWYLNWGLGCLGLLLSIVLVISAIWSIVIQGMSVHFFKLK